VLSDEKGVMFFSEYCKTHYCEEQAGATSAYPNPSPNLNPNPNLNPHPHPHLTKPRCCSGSRRATTVCSSTRATCSLRG